MVLILLIILKFPRIPRMFSEFRYNFSRLDQFDFIWDVFLHSILVRKKSLMWCGNRVFVGYMELIKHIIGLEFVSNSVFKQVLLEWQGKNIEFRYHILKLVTCISILTNNNVCVSIRIFFSECRSVLSYLFIKKDW